MARQARGRLRFRQWAACVWLTLITPAPTVVAEELKNPPICSVETVGKVAELDGFCEVTPLQGGGKKVKINLTATTGPIQIGGYTVTTEHYNDSYLTPVVEAIPGDTVAARLMNWLAPRKHEPMVHGDGDENPTNLHYFHGGIVTPRNSRELGDASGNPRNLGDNVYVHLKAGRELPNQSSAEFNVPIPGEGKLDARVLELEEKDQDGYIAHPTGLGWYHSHLHGISSDQVMGGMSGLLSVGAAKENLKVCDPTPGEKCNIDVDKTSDLRKRTEVSYVLLRDIPLRKISAHPDGAIGATAEWAPADRDLLPPEKCGIWTPDGSHFLDDPNLHKGFCQRSGDSKSAWLFTLNGQRFPTITVKGGSNVLLRMANVSANVAYWLELRKCDAETGRCDGKTKDLTILSVDGVVPARPSESAASAPAFKVPELLLMAASRAEIFISNSEEHPDEQEYVLWTKGPNMGTDHWPKIQLARIVLQPNPIEKTMVLALNAPVAQMRLGAAVSGAPLREPEMPPGCVRDLDLGEHRRVIFFQPGVKPEKFSVGTEIVHFPLIPTSECKGDKCAEEEFQPDPKETVGIVEGDLLTDGFPFEDYEQGEGGIDWNKKHVCIKLRPGGGSHKQLWVLRNETGAVHNFHIHQMKFRLATKDDLAARKIIPPERSHTCADPTPSDPCNSIPSEECGDPGYKFYEDGCDKIDPKTTPIWHDTIPVPIGQPVFLIMSFDAQEQVGRFVFHCHILKHEDRGLMAPIEVWDPTFSAADR